MRHLFFSGCFFLLVGAFSLEHLVHAGGGMAAGVTGALVNNATPQSLSGPALSGAGPAGEAAPADTAKILDDYKAELEKMTPEEREFYTKNTAGAQVAVNPMVRRMLESGTGSGKSSGASASFSASHASPGANAARELAERINAEYYPAFKERIFTALWVAPLLLLGAAVFCLVAQFGGAAGFLCNTVIEGTGLAMSLFSLVSVFVGWFCGRQAGFAMMWDFLPSPAVFLVLSASLARLVDMNYPVVSRVKSYLVLPILCALALGGMGAAGMSGAKR